MDMSKANNFLIRTLSGVVLLVAVVAALWISQYTFFLLLLIIAGMVMWEFMRLSNGNPQRFFTIFTGLSVLVALLRCGWEIATVVAATLMAVIFIRELYRKSERPLENIAVSICAIAYGAMPMGLLGLTSSMGGEYSPELIFVCILTVWINDIFAYLTGMAFGRHRLFERISPKKSWEGFAGGVIAAVVFAFFAGGVLDMNRWVWAGLGLVIALSAVAGDLVESMFKRAAGVKDSGNAIPGHGGFMDRFDALIMASVSVFVYLYLYYNIF